MFHLWKLLKCWDRKKKEKEMALLNTIPTGVGIDIKETTNGDYVVKSVKDRLLPLRVDDVIGIIDGVYVRQRYNLEKVKSMLMGEYGTSVKVTIFRGGHTYTYMLSRYYVFI